MKYHCKAVITYDFAVEATTPEEAEQIAFEGLADDVIDGAIRTDLFKPVDGTNGFPFPFLESVEVEATQ